MALVSLILVWNIHFGIAMMHVVAHTHGSVAWPWTLLRIIILHSWVCMACLDRPQSIEP
jgi:hypothetical protein